MQNLGPKDGPFFGILFDQTCGLSSLIMSMFSGRSQKLDMNIFYQMVFVLFFKLLLLTKFYV